jgi:hypothetical protein
VEQWALSPVEHGSLWGRAPNTPVQGSWWS